MVRRRPGRGLSPPNGIVRPCRAVERLAVARSDPRPARVLLGQPSQLHGPDGRPNLVEAVVEARQHDVVARGVPAVAIPGERRHAVRAQKPQSRCQLLVVGDEHAALADRQVLVREEAEAADVAERAAHATAQACPRRVGRVLDDGEAVTLCDLVERGHVAGETGVMQDNHRLRLLRNRRLHICRIEVQFLGADDVAENRLGAGVLDRVRRGDEVQRRNHHLVAGPATDGQQGQVQRRGAVGDGDGVLGTAERCELALELLHPRPHAPPTGANDGKHCLDELVVDGHVGERYMPAGLGHRPILTEPS